MADEIDEDKDSRMLSGLCYIPFLLINFIAIAYVLITKKGGKYARYHALQALFFFIAIFIVSIIIEIPIMVFLIWSWINFLSNPIQAESGFLNIFVIIIPVMILSLLLLLVYLYFAFLAFSGKRFRLPLISNQVDKLVQ